GYNSLRRDGHSFSLRIVTSAEATPAALKLFFKFHALRAARRDTVPHPNVFASATTRAFITDYAKQLARRGGLRIFQLEIAGQIVATRITFQLGDELYLYYSGYRPEWAPYSVATTLVAEIARWAIANRIRILNLSVGRDVSKTRWGPSVVRFESAEQLDTSAAISWRRRLYVAARRQSRDRKSIAGRWLSAMRRNDFGNPEP
ncbi:MAG: GNAT family N-acetyltransferase, partial [Panacagrimonas sp.]